MGFRESSILALMDLGLNRLETLVYLALLREPGVTGYRVGKAIGKPASNVYTALESLLKKGAVILNYVDRDKRFTPVPVQEFTKRMRSEIDARAKLVEDELREFDAIPQDSGIYRLENEEQLFEKINSMLDGAVSTVLLTADTNFIRRLERPVSAAAGRGVRVLVLTFDRDLAIADCEMLRLIPKCGENAWPGYWIVLDVDGIQHVIAFFEHMDTLSHAIWCNDQYVSFWMHFGMLADFTLMTFFNQTADGDEISVVKRSLAELYKRYNHMVPGVKSLYTFLGEERDPRPCGSEDQQDE